MTSVDYGCICRESAENRYVPNAGFFENAVFEDPSISSSFQTSDSTEGDGEISIDQQSNNESNVGVESLAVNDPQVDSVPALTTSNNDENNSTNEITASVGSLKLADAVSADEPNDQLSLSTADIDSLLDKCLLQALHTTVKDKDLPMPGSTLW